MLHKSYKKKSTRELKSKIKENINKTKSLFQDNICPYIEKPSRTNLTDIGHRINENELFSLFTAEVIHKKLIFFR